jgi:hypothetical protein
MLDITQARDVYTLCYTYRLLPVDHGKHEYYQYTGDNAVILLAQIRIPANILIKVNSDELQQTP